MLDVESLHYRRAEHTPWLVSNLSFRLEPGQKLGIQGPSGCGKTTLAKLLAGYLPPTAGSIRLNGAQIPDQGPNPIQLVFQHPELAFNPRHKLGRSLCEGWIPDSVICAQFGLQADWMERYPHEVSGGQLQRLALVRALVPGLRVLICDEITASHDAISQVQIWRALLDHARALEIALVIISHDRALLAALGALAITPWGESRDHL